MRHNRLVRRLILVTFICSQLLPLCSIIILGSLITVFSSDVTVSASVVGFLDAVNELLVVGCVFATSACISFALVNSRKPKSVLIISLLSAPILYIASTFVDTLFYGKEFLNFVYLIPILVNCLVELLRYCLVIIVSKLALKLALKKEMADGLSIFSLSEKLSLAVMLTALTVFVSMLFANLTETLSLLSQYGAPTSSSELFYLMIPYFTSVTYFAVGYFVVFFTMKLLLCERKAG